MLNWDIAVRSMLDIDAANFDAFSDVGLTQIESINYEIEIITRRNRLVYGTLRLVDSAKFALTFGLAATLQHDKVPLHDVGVEHFAVAFQEREQGWMIETNAIAIKIDAKPWCFSVLDKTGNIWVEEGKANTKTFHDVPVNDYSDAEFDYITFPFGSMSTRME